LPASHNFFAPAFRAVPSAGTKRLMHAIMADGIFSRESIFARKKGGGKTLAGMEGPGFPE
jgi:hypothetical protein